MPYTRTQLSQIASVLLAVTNLYTLRNVKRAREVAAITREGGVKWTPPSGEKFHDANLGDVADFWDQVAKTKIVAVSPYGAIVMTSKAQGVDHTMVCDYVKSFIVPPFRNIGDFNESTDSLGPVLDVLNRAVRQARLGYNETQARNTLAGAAAYWNA